MADRPAKKQGSHNRQKLQVRLISPTLSCAGGPACNTHPGERLRPLFWALISPSCSFHEVRSVHTRGQRETVKQAKKTAICIRSEWNAAPSLFETLKYLETHRCETALRLYYQPVTFLCERRRLHRHTPAQSEKEEGAGFKAEVPLHRRTPAQSEKEEGAGFKAEAPLRPWPSELLDEPALP